MRLNMENILIGPEFKCNIPDVSIGKLYFEYLKNVQESEEIVVDGVTHAGVTCKDIFERSVRLAIALRNLGVVAGDVVGIICQNHIEYFVPLLASFYLGAIVHPLNPIYTLHEIQHGFDITKPKIIFTGESTLKSLLTLQKQRDYLKHLVVFGQAGDDGTSVYSYAELTQTTEDIQGFRPTEVSTDAVLVVLSSSGTTGPPKGVMLTNKNVRFSLSYIGHPYFHMDKGDSTIGVVPFFHVLGFLVGLGTLRLGVRSVVLDKFKPDSFLKIMQDFKVSLLFIVPSLALFLAKSELVQSYDLSSLKYIYCGAAPLGIEVYNILKNRLSVSIKQVYGMTETSGSMAISPDDVEGKSGNSGRVIHGLQLKIEDVETREIVGANKVGEICCKGLCTMRGYFGNPEASREIFDQDGFLHTGDLGYYDEDGFLYVVDRLKELIKFKGFQVSPSELEDILTSHDGIKEAGVVGVPDERSGELPMAFVVRQNGANITENEIKDFLAEYVSVQKQLHGGVRFVDEIPKGGSGKILRRKLREMI